MYFDKRKYSIEEVTEIKTLAHMITQHKWPECKGFKYRNLLFLNDSTPHNEVQEYVVVKEKFSDSPDKEWSYFQIESFTVSNMEEKEFRGATLRAMFPNIVKPWDKEVTLQIESVEKHSCHRCG